MVEHRGRRWDFGDSYFLSSKELREDFIPSKRDKVLNWVDIHYWSRNRACEAGYGGREIRDTEGTNSLVSYGRKPTDGFNLVPGNWSWPWKEVERWTKKKSHCDLLRHQWFLLCIQSADKSRIFSCVMKTTGSASFKQKQWWRFTLKEIGLRLIILRTLIGVDFITSH